MVLASVTIALPARGQSPAAPPSAPDTRFEDNDKGALYFGLRLRGGGRYDNVRACVATPAGVPGGPAADIAFVTQIGLRPSMRLDIDLPVMRPILFAAAFEMLQYEPSVTIEFSRPLSVRTELFGGPTLGLSLHYGPDFDSENEGPGRTSSFFATGPTLGGRVGFAFGRNDHPFSSAVSVSPYVTPLFGIDDPDNHRGIVVGGLVDVTFRFRAR
jgi:hypothetical protein